MPPKPMGLNCLTTSESKRKADTEIQYRPSIVDTDIDCGPRFGGPRFRDSYDSNLGDWDRGGSKRTER